MHSRSIARAGGCSARSSASSPARSCGAATGYHGMDVVRAARISGSAHGGQILVSSATRDLVGDAVEGVSFRDLGEHRLKDIELPQRQFQVLAPGLTEDFPPPRTEDAAR